MSWSSREDPELFFEEQAIKTEDHNPHDDFHELDFQFNLETTTILDERMEGRASSVTVPSLTGMEETARPDGCAGADVHVDDFDPTFLSELYDCLGPHSPTTDIPASPTPEPAFSESPPAVTPAQGVLSVAAVHPSAANGKSTTQEEKTKTQRKSHMEPDSRGPSAVTPAQVLSFENVHPNATTGKTTKQKQNKKTSSPEAPCAVTPAQVPSVAVHPTTEKKTKKKQSKKNQQANALKYVKEIRDADVLCGRGGRSNRHPGNRQYRRTVRELQPEYEESTKNDKTSVSQGLVDAIRRNGGRFLAKDNGVGKWYVVPNLQARRKASQALREHHRDVD